MGLRTLLVSVAAFGAVLGWIVVQVKWIHDRHAALDWLKQQRISWYAPSLRGARVEASAPWGMRLLNERGIVAIGLADDASAAFSSERLERLFPGARVGYTDARGRLLDSRTELR